MDRDAGICYICKDSGADQVDHIRRGNDHSLSNLAAVHGNVYPYCHRYKSSAEGNARMRELRAKAKQPKEQHPGLHS